MPRLLDRLPTRLGAALAVLAVISPLQSVVGQDSRAGRPAGQPASGKKVLTINDYTRWRALEAPQLSPDGNWLSYVQRQTNVVATASKPALHIKRLDGGTDTAVVDATQATFSSDSRWVAYLIEPPPPSRPTRDSASTPGGAPSPAPSDTTAPTRGARTPPPQRRAELRELATGKVMAWQDIQSASFSSTASHLLLRRRPPGNAGATAGAAAPGGPGGGGTPSTTVRAADALLHHLATGLTTYLGNVGEAAFNRTGDLLAYTVEAPVKDANGLFVIDLATGRTWVLDNDARTYSRLAWNDSGTGLAVLKGKEVPRMRERENVLLAVPSVRAAMRDGVRPTTVALDSTATGFPRGWVISDRATLSWSDDNRRVFLGLIGQGPAPDTAKRRNTDSLPDVDVWRTEDERVQSLQMIRAEADRNYTFRQAFDLGSGAFVRLADSTMRELDVAPDGSWAIGRDLRGYVTDYGRQQADVYRVDVTTGQRTLMFKALIVEAFAYGFSPDAKHWVYWKDERFHQYDASTGTSQPLIATGAPSFVNREFDHPGPKPSYGVAGYSADGTGVIVNHRYDLWYLPYAAGQPRNLTNSEGTRQEVVFRIVRTAPPEPLALRAARDGRIVDLSQPLTLASYGEWTKKSGFHTLAAGALRPIVYEDATFSTPMRAARADTWLFTRQTFIEFPDLRVSGPDFATSRKVTDANPQQAEYAWGRRVLFDFKLKDGTRSQGVLTLPDDYQAGEKRPMIVSFYEKNSQNLHRYTAPSFVTGMGSLPVEAVSKGYITMMPDVYFRTGQSHSDMLEAVEAATRKVIELGYADPKKVGVHGHSYGGEGAAFIGTRSRMFAAIGVGAGVTDLTTDFAQSWGWTYAVTGGSGDNAFEYYLNGQGRWGFSPWDKPEVYRFESALTHVPQATAPFLIMHGTADPTVSFVEGMNLYSALRYNKKQAIMLAYPNEGHGLRGLANRRDLTERYFQFFDHYLRGRPAPAWMTQGVPFLVKETTRVVP